MIKPHPSQVIPLGFAIINPASPPKTSICPFKLLAVLATWNRIRDASLPAVILGLAGTTISPNWAVPPPALLFKIVPYELTLKSSTELLENPSTGLAMLKTITSPTEVIQLLVPLSA